MSRIVLIDTKIDASLLRCSSFAAYDVTGSPSQPSGRLSHGTACALVLDHCTEDYSLISVEAFSDSAAGQKPRGSIEALRDALQLCLDLQPDIVSLSAGSTTLSNSSLIAGLCMEICRKSVFVAALDNLRYVTVPASYPFVFGVQSDRAGLLAPGQLACRPGDLFGAELYANCAFDFLTRYGCTPSNSLAVPVAAASINQLLNAGAAPEHLFSALPVYDIDAMREVASFPQGPAGNPPVVLLEGGAVRLCQGLMDALQQEYDIEAAGVSPHDIPEDIRIRHVKQSGSLLNAVQFVRQHYKADIILVAAEAEAAGAQLEPDVRISLHASSAELQYDNCRCAVPVGRLAGELCHILSCDEPVTERRSI